MSGTDEGEAPMRRVTSCGFALTRVREGKLELLLMRHKNRYDFPKGHMEEGETQMQTARRELAEETGLSADDVDVDPLFRYVTTYHTRYRRFGGARVEKTLVLFGGVLRASGDGTFREVEHSEHAGSEWLPWARWGVKDIGTKAVDDMLVALRAHYARHGFPAGVARARPALARITPASSPREEEACSCGVLLFRRRGGTHELLLVRRKKDGKIGLPKGHMEPGEDERATMLRELHEECGVRESDIVIDPRFEHTCFYVPPKYDAARFRKRLVMFLAWVRKPGQLTLSLDERRTAEWMDWADCLAAPSLHGDYVDACVRAARRHFAAHVLPAEVARVDTAALTGTCKACGFALVTARPEAARVTGGDARVPSHMLLMHHANRVDLPKGMVDPGEEGDEFVTALRELEEETGIPRHAVVVDRSFRFQQTYYPPGWGMEKTLVIFLAWLIEPVDVRASSEHKGAEWRAWSECVAGAEDPNAVLVQRNVLSPLLHKMHAHFQRGGHPTPGDTTQ